MTQSLEHIGSCAIVLFMLMSGSIAAAAGKSMIIVGGDNEFPPYEFLENGEPAGFNIDLIRAVADIMGLDVEIRLGPWNETKKDLEQGKIDVISGMVYSEERDKIFNFSVPHTMIFPSLFVRSDSTIQTLADIEGKEIIVQEGDIMQDFLRKEYPAVRIVPVTHHPEALKLVASGKHHGALQPSGLHRYYTADTSVLDSLRFVKIDLPPLRYCFAVTKENSVLLYKLDQGLILLKSTGSYQKIYEKWFGVYERMEWWESIKYFVLGLALTMVGLAASLLWNSTLKRLVKIQTDELRKASIKLEERVEARTIDLARSNERLQSEINERHKIEEALRENEEKYRAIVESFDGQIYICSPDYKIEFMNRNLIQRSGRDATGEPCYKILHDRDSICPWCINDRVQKGQTVRWEVRSPKDNLWYYVVNTPIYRADGSISKQAMILDITERVHAEREKRKLVAQNLQLQKAESLGRMAGAIAHHFNNKLHVVSGHIKQAMNRLPQVDTSENTSEDTFIADLSAAMRAADQAAEVSRSMLTYLGKVTGNRTPLNLAEICKRSLLLIQATLPEKIAFKTDFPIPHPAITTNANQIQLILTHLVSNAMEAIGDSRGTIHLTVKMVSPADIPTDHRFPVNWQPNDKFFACLEMRDTGCGIPAKGIEEAFDPFFSTKLTGRGMGLSVVFGITQAHGGVVTVESEPDRGSIFCVFFPVSEEKAPLQPNTTANIAKIEGEGTVLLVDDDKTVLTITGQMLSQLGFTVLSAMDGIEALEVFRHNQGKIRFVLSDFSMPRMNGLEMLTSLRKIAPDIPVILASGYNEEKVMDAIRAERPHAFLGKPFGYQELKEAIFCSLGDS
jgi:signal transduction histidine kinase/ABC-type amino acid transport substrate-binding protein/ActR/RegA family two-component response regulator